VRRLLRHVRQARSTPFGRFSHFEQIGGGDIKELGKDWILIPKQARPDNESGAKTIDGNILGRRIGFQAALQLSSEQNVAEL
jgi:hypothetical protein